MIVSAVASFAKNYPEVEPNNSFPPSFFTNNPVLESGDTISGSINPAGDIDQFYITCFGGGLPGVYRYTFDVASGSDTYLEIFDATTGGNILGVLNKVQKKGRRIAWIKRKKAAAKVKKPKSSAS